MEKKERKIKNVNVFELQAKISKILKEIQKDTDYIILRYSRPIAVLISVKEYKKLIEEIEDLKKECRECIFRKRAQKGQ